MTVNVHLFGLGKISYSYELNKKDTIKNHFKAIQNHSKFNLTSIHEINNLKIDNFLKKQKITNIYVNSLSSIKKKDLVIVGVNAEKQYEILKKLIKQSKVGTILCEKPFTTNLKQQKKILKLCKKNKIKLFVNYIRISDPNYIKIFRFLKNSKKIKYKINIFYSNGIFNNASHYINFLCKCFGNPISYKVNIYNSIKKNNFDYNFDFDIEFNNSKVKFLYKKYDINLEMTIKSEKNKILIYKKKPIKFNDKVLRETIKNYQYNVIDNIYKYYKKTNYSLCSGEQAHQTFLVCTEIVKRSKWKN